MSPDGVGATRTFTTTSGGGTSRASFAGVISGAEGSNFIKSGNGEIVLLGLNTYRGTTAQTAGNIWFNRDVLPGQAGSFGISDTPIQIAADSLIASGQLTIGRDLIFTGNASLLTQASWLVSVTGNVNVASGATLTVSGLRGAGHGLGGIMDLQGAVTGAGALSLGKADTTGDRTGNVRLSSPNANGISANTYSGGTTLSWGRVQINSDAFFTGPASTPTNIISSPFGTGPLTFRAIAGTSTLEAFGADRVVVNPMAAATPYTINSS